MHKFSIIGFGGHTQKNILPAFSRSNNLQIDGVYVRDVSRYSELVNSHDLKCFSVTDIHLSPSDWFYISTPIASHYDLVKKCLLLKKNVICEKPLTLSKTHVTELFNIADDNNVTLYEVDMYKHHRQFKHLKKATIENFSDLKSLSVKFSIPHLADNDIRYSPSMGGGALRDVGYYPISLITSLFNFPSNINSSIFSEIRYEVDLSGSALFTYDNFYCVAEWGIGQPYSNNVKLITKNAELSYDRIFSKPHNFETAVRTKETAGMEEKLIGQDDQFLNMLSHITESPEEDFIRNRQTSILVHDVIDLVKANGPYS
tara:strand:- start:212 stop:1156 length:945 start_codon:yes stop_codon:yes gene_type:complete